MKKTEYYYTFCIRSSEITAFEQLPDISAQRITPIVLLAPWANSKFLQNSITKIDSLMGKKEYFLDIDRYYTPSETIASINEAQARPAVLSWQNLTLPNADLGPWWDLIEESQNANPCLILHEKSESQVWNQVHRARSLGRAFCLRIQRDKRLGLEFQNWIPNFIRKLESEGTDDYVIVLEFGWQLNPDEVYVPASIILSRILESLTLNADDNPGSTPIVISYTSFPRHFSNIRNIEELQFDNRRIVENIRRDTNYPNLIYGDWGSTRPRLSQGGGGRTPVRIDYPLERSWVIARTGMPSATFQQAAKVIVGSDHWNGNLGIWGEEMIQAAADGDRHGVNTIPKMTAARINIHLHQQANFGDLPTEDQLVEAWPDDL